MTDQSTILHFMAGPSHTPHFSIVRWPKSIVITGARDMKGVTHTEIMSAGRQAPGFDTDTHYC
jgi:hypothetical protein